MARRGFTLIELLVVIAIIGLLSSVTLASLESARTKARDARRVSDFSQYKRAFNLYYDDNGAWPCAGVSGAATYIDDQTHCLATALAPYMSKIPVDPLYGDNGTPSWGLDYQYQSNGTQYYLRTSFETDIRPATHGYPGNNSCAPSGGTACSWYGEECVYRTGSCNTYWIHMGES